MKHKLPFNIKPIFLSYHSNAFPTGIMQANAPADIINWICSMTVNCSFKSNKFDLVSRDIWGFYDRILIKQKISIKKDIIIFFKENLISVLKKLIINGYYVHGTYNEKYIPGKFAYGVQDYPHDFLLIGCDDNCFISVGYMGDGNFREFMIPDDNMRDSLLKLPGIAINLDFYDYNPEASFKVNIETMIEDLENYIKHENVLNYSKALYGQEAIFALKKHFIETANSNNGYIDSRYTRVLYEHEWVLKQIVLLLLPENEEKNKFVVQTKSNYEKAQLIHMLGLKMKMTGNVELVYKISYLIDEILESEQEYIPCIVESFKKCID